MISSDCGQPPAEYGVERPRWPRGFGVCVALALLTLLVFEQSVRYEFIS
jgi:hypothetical protein